MSRSSAELLASAGAVFGQGDPSPLSFGDVDAEYRALASAAGLAFMPMGLVEAAGNDRAKFIHNFCTNDIVKLSAGTGCEAFFLNPKGKVVDYGFIVALAAELWICLEPGRGLAMVKHLDRFLFREDVKLRDASDDYQRLRLAGPISWSVLQAVIGNAEEPPPDLRASSIQIHGQNCQLVRRDWASQVGFDLVVPTAALSDIWRTALEATIERGGRPVGDLAIQIARIEAGLPRFGVDISEDNLPQELGREASTISFTKGCYIGQETVARLDAYGHVNKLLRGLLADADIPLEPGQQVSRDGKPIGTITSAATSPKLGKRIALAVLRTAGGEPGASVQIETQDGTAIATVTELPFTCRSLVPGDSKG